MWTWLKEIGVVGPYHDHLWALYCVPPFEKKRRIVDLLIFASILCLKKKIKIWTLSMCKSHGWQSLNGWFSFDTLFPEICMITYHFHVDPRRIKRLYDLYIQLIQALPSLKSNSWNIYGFELYLVHFILLRRNIISSHTWQSSKWTNFQCNPNIHRVSNP